MGFFDSHRHLNDEKFDEDRNKVIKEIYEAGTTNFVTAGYSVESSQKAIDIANNYDFIYATAGISPNDIPQTEEELWKTIAEIKELILQNEKIVAVGEIGLDYYWKQDNKELQIKAFEKQIELANELKLPISIHTRDSIDDTISIIDIFTYPIKNRERKIITLKPNDKHFNILACPEYYQDECKPTLIKKGDTK